MRQQKGQNAKQRKEEDVLCPSVIMLLQWTYWNCYCFFFLVKWKLSMWLLTLVFFCSFIISRFYLNILVWIMIEIIKKQTLVWQIHKLMKGMSPKHLIIDCIAKLWSHFMILQIIIIKWRCIVRQTKSHICELKSKMQGLKKNEIKKLSFCVTLSFFSCYEKLHCWSEELWGKKGKVKSRGGRILCWDHLRNVYRIQ